MRVPHLVAVICIAVISAGAFLNFGNAQQDGAFNDNQKDEINKMIREYILENPEIIPEAVQVLRARQNARMLLDTQDLVYNDGYSHVAGNENGDITIVEFYDYNCGYCKRVPDVLARLIREDKNLKVIFKEFPIFDGSDFAAKAAMASENQGKFMEFHNALMKNKRPLNEELVLRIARDAGLDEDTLVADMEDPRLDQNIRQTQMLAQNLGMSGTPGFIIGSQIIAGFQTYDQLKAIIEKEREALNS